MRYPIDEPIDADFEVLSSGPPRSALRVTLDRLVFATIAVVLTCIFAAICAGAALGAAFLSSR
ncbi:hypothetical protein LJR225_003853 [Phenylobacterium sp. LjRoot225]|uniref:hypothetical protein n=1 Tax=Phenylobacterium sp. LjRoot225 TaxID=3342285 RepID=UPI003ECFA90A